MLVIAEIFGNFLRYLLRGFVLTVQTLHLKVDSEVDEAIARREMEVIIDLIDKKYNFTGKQILQLQNQNDHNQPEFTSLVQVAASMFASRAIWDLINFYEKNGNLVFDKNSTDAYLIDGCVSTTLNNQLNNIKRIASPFGQDQLDWINDRIFGLTGNYLSVFFKLVVPGIRADALDLRVHFFKDSLGSNPIEQKIFLDQMIELARNNDRAFNWFLLNDLVLLIYKQRGLDALRQFFDTEHYPWIVSSAKCNHMYPWISSIHGFLGNVFVDFYKQKGALVDISLPSVFDDSSWSIMYDFVASSAVRLDDVLVIINCGNCPESESDLKHLLSQRRDKLQTIAFKRHPKLYSHPELKIYHFCEITDVNALLDIARNVKDEETKRGVVRCLIVGDLDWSSIVLEQHHDILLQYPIPKLSVEQLTPLWSKFPGRRVGVLSALMWKLLDVGEASVDAILIQIQAYYDEAGEDNPELFLMAVQTLNDNPHPRLASMLWSWGVSEIREELRVYIAMNQNTYLRYIPPTYGFETYPVLTYPIRQDFVKFCQQVMLDEFVLTMDIDNQYLYFLLNDQIVMQNRECLVSCFNNSSHSQKRFYEGIFNLSPNTVVEKNMVINSNRVVTDPVWRLLLTFKEQITPENTKKLKSILGDGAIPKHVSQTMIKTVLQDIDLKKPEAVSPQGILLDDIMDVLTEKFDFEAIGLSKESVYELLQEFSETPMGVMSHRATSIVRGLCGLYVYNLACFFATIWMSDSKLHNSNWLLTLAILTPGCEELLAGASKKRGEKSNFLVWELGKLGSKSALQKLTYLWLGSDFFDVGDILVHLDKYAYEQSMQLYSLIDELVLDTSGLRAVFAGNLESSYQVHLNSELKIRFSQKSTSNSINKISGPESATLQYAVKELKTRAKLYCENATKWLNNRRAEQYKWQYPEWKSLFCADEYRLTLLEGVVWLCSSLKENQLETFVVKRNGDIVDSSGKGFVPPEDSLVQVWDPSLTPGDVNLYWRKYCSDNKVKSIYSRQLVLPTVLPVLNEDLSTHITNYKGVRVEKNAMLKVMKKHSYVKWISHSGDIQSLASFYHTQDVQTVIRVKQQDRPHKNKTVFLIVDGIDCIKFYKYKYREYITPDQGVWSDIVALFNDLLPLHEPLEDSNIFMKSA